MPGEQARKNFIQEFGKWVLVFLAFGLIGWVYEVAIMYFEMHQGFVNRGFLLGPCLPLYGFGGLIITAVTGKFRKHPLLCFLVICLLTTGTELLVSYIMEWWMGSFLWDYRDAGYGPTFEGRIALRSSLQFGLIGIATVYIIYPLLDKVITKVRKRFPWVFMILWVTLFAVFLADVVWHLIHGSNASW